MACWWDNNKVLSNKIASLEVKLLKALSQERQDNGRMDWLGLDPSHYLVVVFPIACQLKTTPIIFKFQGDCDYDTPCPQFFFAFLALFLLLLFSTLPNLWLKITSSAWLVGDNPSSLLNFPSGHLLSGEAVVKILTCNNLNLYAVGYASPSSKGERIPMPPLPSWEESDPVPLKTLEVLPPTPSHAPWLITGLVLMD
ncbi:hypothetical protein DSO57_1002391 [Entomophthora muscae]|uniref:Uncharacterized protein n=1 Tax=Entomophthora muscae TaxID=34485 RepID=A0ACC2RNP9_9FUNG|nr:hypothetical protein DSO57_1002391 [Entomophthora muscae]